MFPDEEFLPRAPDPDEIVIGGDEDGPTEAAGEDPPLEPRADPTEPIDPVPNAEE